MLFEILGLGCGAIQVGFRRGREVIQTEQVGGLAAVSRVRQGRAADDLAAGRVYDRIGGKLYPRGCPRRVRHARYLLLYAVVGNRLFVLCSAEFVRGIPLPVIADSSLQSGENAVEIGAVAIVRVPEIISQAPECKCRGAGEWGACGEERRAHARRQIGVVTPNRDRATCAG